MIIEKENSGHKTSSPTHDADAGDVAPLADAFIVEAVNGPILPYGTGAGGGQRSGVEVAGDGVDGEEDEATASIDFDFDAVHALFFPADVGAASIEGEFEHRFHGRGIGGVFGADDVEVVADGLGVAGALLDDLDEVENTVEGTGRDRCDAGGQCGRGEGGQLNRVRAGAVEEQI